MGSIRVFKSQYERLTKHKGSATALVRRAILLFEKGIIKEYEGSLIEPLVLLPISFNAGYESNKLRKIIQASLDYIDPIIESKCERARIEFESELAKYANVQYIIKEVDDED